MFLGTIWDPFGLGDIIGAISDVARRICIARPSRGTPLYCFMAVRKEIVLKKVTKDQEK